MLSPVKYDPSTVSNTCVVASHKPVVDIFPVDRTFIQSYISSVCCTLLFNKFSKRWVEVKANEWNSMSVEDALNDMLNYVHFNIRSSEPPQY